MKQVSQELNDNDLTRVIGGAAFGRTKATIGKTGGVVIGSEEEESGPSVGDVTSLDDPTFGGNPGRLPGSSGQLAQGQM